MIDRSSKELSGPRTLPPPVNQTQSWVANRYRPTTTPLHPKTPNEVQVPVLLPTSSSAAASARLATTLRPDALPPLPSKTNGPASFLGVIGPSGPDGSPGVGVATRSVFEGSPCWVLSPPCDMLGLLEALGEGGARSVGLVALMPR